MRDETGADVALLPGVGYGVAIPAGPITAAQLRQLIPHDGTVFTMPLAGAQIREILEQSNRPTWVTWNERNRDRFVTDGLTDQ